jgi:phosphoenolpyruvate synthase/pyruvate phosphate dikinase
VDRTGQFLGQSPIDHPLTRHLIGTCEGLGLDYVSCSPYRVPIARLAAAQAALS